MRIKKERLKTLIIRFSGLLLGLLIGFLLPSEILFRDTAENTADDSGEQEYWACPMLCVTLESPGICPVCGMDLELFVSTGDEVVLSRQDQEMIELTVTEVSKRVLHTEFTAPAMVEFDDSRTYFVSARTGGRIEKLYVEYTGESVDYGQNIADIYSPELYEAGQELSVAATGGLDTRLIALAENKLALLGVSNSEINRIANGGEVTAVTTVTAPAAGTVTDIVANEGEYVSTGTPLIEISDTNSPLLSITLTEDQSGLVESGYSFEFYLHSRRGVMFSGIVNTVDPFLQITGAVTEARAILDNENGVFLSGQSASVTFSIPYGDESVLSVPRNCVLALGERHIVYIMTAPLFFTGETEGELRLDEIKFIPVLVTVGALCSDASGNLYYPILSGLQEDDVVALEGAFLIDSQAELLGLPSLLGD